MATFKIVLDTRVKKKDDKYNLALRISKGSDIMYINLQKMTVKQQEHVFVRESMDLESIKFRETCNQYKSKCEKIFNQLKPFNKERFRELFWCARFTPGFNSVSYNPLVKSHIVS